MTRFTTCVLGAVVFVMGLAVPVSASGLKAEDVELFMKMETVTGNIVVNRVTSSFKITSLKFDSDGTFTGQIEWDSPQTVRQIEGIITDDEIDFRESYVANGKVKPVGQIQLTVSSQNGTISGPFESLEREGVKGFALLAIQPEKMDAAEQNSAAKVAAAQNSAAGVNAPKPGEAAATLAIVEFAEKRCSGLAIDHPKLAAYFKSGGFDPAQLRTTPKYLHVRDIDIPGTVAKYGLAAACYDVQSSWYVPSDPLRHKIVYKL